MLKFLFGLLFYTALAAAVAPTDEYRDADQSQSGYLPNHNMDPNVVGSSIFGELWRKSFNTKERV